MSSSINASQQRGMEVLKWVDRGLNTAVISTVALFILTIVFLGLAQASYIHPVAALYSFGGTLLSLFAVKMIDMARGPVAAKYHINLDAYDKVHTPPPKPKKKD